MGIVKIGQNTFSSFLRRNLQKTKNPSYRK